jgi:endonuclease YncB( thermonuclease family)
MPAEPGVLVVHRMLMPRRLRRLAVLALSVAALAVAYAASTGDRHPDTRAEKDAPRADAPRKRDAPKAPRKADAPRSRDADPRKGEPSRKAEPGLVLGEFRVGRVIDGDTVRVDGLDASLRLLGVDAEETFKLKADRRAAETDWNAYVREKRGSRRRPVKFGSPMGEAAKAWGQRWFEGVTRVRIERDHPAEVLDRFDRYLAYVLAEKDGRWLNYNVELVRAGMSPYFPKYGNSRRFHEEFVEAQAEAKAQRRGIWQPGATAYPDYAEREAWWTARGDFVAAFRREADDKPDYIDITQADALTRLEQRAGKEVHVLGTLDDVARSSRGGSRNPHAKMEHDRRRWLSLVFADLDVFKASGVAAWEGEFVVVIGRPAIREASRGGDKQVQIMIDRASQIRRSKVPGLSPPPDTPDTPDSGR